MPAKNDKNRTNDFMKEKKTHGNLEYPVAVYHVDLHNLYVGFVRWHWHEELEIDVVTEGRMECLIGDDSFMLETGDCIFINQNIMHSIHPVDGEPGRFDAIVFHPTILFSYGNTYMHTKYLTPIVGNANLKSLIVNHSFASFEEITDYLSELVEVNTNMTPGYELITKSCLCRFWVIMIREFGSTKTIKESRETLSLSDSRAKDAVLFIQDHYNEPITLDDIASAIHVSKSECCRSFKRVLRCTPFQYLMKYRIFMSSLKIRENTGNSLSFSDIAVSVGFNNVSYFNKLFKSFLACTPSQYRKKLRDGELEYISDFSPLNFEEHIKQGD